MNDNLTLKAPADTILRDNLGAYQAVVIIGITRDGDFVLMDSNIEGHIEQRRMLEHAVDMMGG